MDKRIQVVFPEGTPEEVWAWFQQAINTGGFKAYHDNFRVFKEGIKRYPIAIFRKHENSTRRASAEASTLMPIEDFERQYMRPTIDLKDIYG